MYKRLIKIFLFLFIQATCYLLLATNVRAQEVSLGIYPPIFQIEANPPIDFKSPLSIQNYSNEPVVLEVSFRQFTSSQSHAGEVEFFGDKEQVPNPDTQIWKKIQLLDNENKSVDQILLAPGEEKILQLAIDLPKNEPPGDYYFSIVFISKGKELNQKNASLTNTGIATNVLLSIGKQTKKTSGLLSEFSTPFWVQQGPIPFTVRMENTSNHFINPEGAIVITNLFGQTVGKVELLPVNVLAHTQRLIPDKKSGSTTQAIWQESFLFGVYHAELTTALSQDGPLFKKTIHFVALPAWFFVGLIITAISVAVIIVGVKYRLKKL